MSKEMPTTRMPELFEILTGKSPQPEKPDGGPNVEKKNGTHGLTLGVAEGHKGGLKRLLAPQVL